MSDQENETRKLVNSAFRAPTRGFGLLEGLLAQQRARLASRLIPADHPRGCILDIGCGSYPVFLLSVEFDKKIGLDRTVETDGFLCELRTNLTLINHDAALRTELPISSDSCDVVSMLAVAEHMERKNFSPLLAEIHRVLSPGGVLIVTTPPPWTDLLLRVMARLKLVSAVEIAEHVSIYSRKNLVTRLREVFPTESVTSGYFQWGLNIWATAVKGTRKSDVPYRCTGGWHN